MDGIRDFLQRDLDACVQILKKYGDIDVEIGYAKMNTIVVPNEIYTIVLDARVIVNKANKQVLSEKEKTEIRATLGELKKKYKL